MVKGKKRVYKYQKIVFHAKSSDDTPALTIDAVVYLKKGVTFAKFQIERMIEEFLMQYWTRSLDRKGQIVKRNLVVHKKSDNIEITARGFKTSWERERVKKIKGRRKPHRRITGKIINPRGWIQK